MGREGGRGEGGRVRERERERLRLRERKGGVETIAQHTSELSRIDPATCSVSASAKRRHSESLFLVVVVHRVHQNYAQFVIMLI